MRSVGRTSIGWLALGATFVVAAPVRSEAADIPEITFTREGPKQPIPLDTAFYLTGTVPAGVPHVRALVVRDTNRPFGISPARNQCERIAAALGAPKRVDDTKDATYKIFGPVTATDDEVGDFFEETSTAPETYDSHEGDPVLLSSLWSNPEPSSKAEAKFKVLVDDTLFFRPGAHFCLFVFEERVKETVDKALEEHLITLAEDLSACVAQPTDDTKDACIAATLSKSRPGRTSILSKMTEEQQTEVTKLIRTELLDALSTLSAKVEIGSWLAPLAKGARPLPLPGQQDASGHVAITGADALTRLVVGILARRSALLIAPPGPAYYTATGDMRVTRIGLASDLKTYQLIGTVDETKKDKPLRTGKADVGGFEIENGVTFADLYALSEGRIRWKNDFERMTDVGNDVDAQLSKGRAMTEDDVKELEALADWTKRVAAVLTDRCMKNPPSPQLTGPRPIYIDEVCEWLEGSVATGPAGAADDRLFGYPPAQFPLTKVSSDLNTRLAAWREVVEGAPKLHRKVFERTAVARATAPRAASFDQESFLTNYVVPVIGRSFVVDPSDDRWFGMTYLGVQIHMYANPVRQPMWSAGSVDAGRLLALELAIGLDGEYGERKLLTGPGATFGRPLMVGAAIHFLPYVSLSGGAAFFSARTSGLDEEETRLVARGYVALSAQINAIDFIAGFFRGASVARLIE